MELVFQKGETFEFSCEKILNKENLRSLMSHSSKFIKKNIL